MKYTICTAFFRLLDQYLDISSGVATYGALGHVPPLEFCKFCAFCSCCQLKCKDFENYQRKHVLNFHLSRQKHAKTHVNRLKRSCNPRDIPGRGGEETIHAVPPSPHFLATPLDISTLNILPLICYTVGPTQ